MFTLHSHSYYTLLQGTIAPETLVDEAKKSGSSFVSLTDTNAMYGLIRFFKAAKEKNIKPILGTYLEQENDPDIHLLLIAANNDGYKKICRFITKRKLKDDFLLPEIFNEDLEGLFILTSSIKLLQQIDLKKIPGDQFFVELIISEKHKKKTRELYEFAKTHKLQITASHPIYFLNEEEFNLHKIVTAIRNNIAVKNLPADKILDEEYRFITPAQLKEKWKALPEALWNAEKIANLSNVDLELGKYKFPVFPLPYGETSFSYLWKLCFRELEKKYQPITEKVIKRLQYELEVIDSLGFSDYFLVVWDIVTEAKKRGMKIIGRGSAANSLVSYCLGFTEVDPIEYNLYFERFLNRGRSSPPDVDLDFSWKERDEIVRYVYDKYGYNKVAMISTMITFRARSAFRETAKAFGIPPEEISEYSKFIPWTSAANLPVLAEKFPESRSLKFENEPWKSIINIASKLSGFPRHLSIHPGGIVITENPITDYTALEFASNKGLGLIITQPDMYSIEDLGLVKIDLLSQRSLGVFRDTIEMINSHDNEEENDPKIFSINFNGEKK